MTTPKVSVLMSCYNASRYLDEAIESVLSQTYADFEFVVVDDGSTDQTLALVRAQAARDSRIVVLEKANTGLTDSLNRGMATARGKWIARLDADDRAEPDRLARQLAFLEQHPAVVLLGTGCTLIDASGTPGRTYRYPRHHAALVAQMAGCRSSFPHSSATFDKQTALGVGGYNRRFLHSQDVDLWLRLSRVGAIACLPEPLVASRRHQANRSQQGDGRYSLITGMAARVCHVLRDRERPDPSMDADEAEWSRFLDWLTTRLEEMKYCELNRQWSRLGDRWRAAGQSQSRWQAAAQVTRGLWAAGDLGKMARHQISRSSFAARLADQWCAAGVTRICRSPSALSD